MANTNTKKNVRTYMEIDGEKTLVTNPLMMGMLVQLAKGEIDSVPQVIIDKAEAHLATLSAKSNAPRRPSAAAKENAEYAIEAYRVMPTDEAVTTLWLMEHVKVNGFGITQVNKMAQVMKLLIDSGKITKDTSGRKVTYTKPSA